MSKLSRGEAREFVNRLTRKYGGILPEELEKISAVAPGVLESLACSRARLASKLIGYFVLIILFSTLLTVLVFSTTVLRMEHVLSTNLFKMLRRTLTILRRPQMRGLP